MTLVKATLATELESMVPTASELEARQRFASAWTAYFYDASVAGTPCSPDSLIAAEAAMVAALAGMSSSGKGANKIQGAVDAFWVVVVNNGTSIWAGTIAPYTAPSTISGIGVALRSVFDANIAARKSLEDAVVSVAQVLHDSGGLGGIATMPGSPPTPTAIL